MPPLASLASLALLAVIVVVIIGATRIENLSFGHGSNATILRSAGPENRMTPSDGVIWDTVPGDPTQALHVNRVISSVASSAGSAASGAKSANNAGCAITV